MQERQRLSRWRGSYLGKLGMEQSSEALWSHTFSPAFREKIPGVYCLFCSVVLSSFDLILLLQTALALIQCCLYCLLALRREQLVKRLPISSSSAPGVFPKKDHLNPLVFNSWARMLLPPRGGTWGQSLFIATTGRKLTEKCTGISPIQDRSSVSMGLFEHCLH